MGSLGLGLKAKISGLGLQSCSLQVSVLRPVAVVLVLTHYPLL